MLTLSISQFKSTRLHPAFNNTITSVELPDEPFDSGAFGEVYKCKINNVEQVVKILTTQDAIKSYQTILKLQDAVIFYNQKLKSEGKKPIEEINALWALPLFSFKGRLKGMEVMGYSTHLLGNDWINCEKFFSDDTDENERKKWQKYLYYELSSESRMQFIYDLLEGFMSLEAMGYVHADINPKNFFINTKEGKLCLIDYDSGGVNEEPETKGKHGDWMAPEIENEERTTANLFTDYWSVAMAVHYFYFPYQPLFYIFKHSKPRMQEYFSKYEYPQINKNESYFNKGCEKRYNNYIECFEELPDDIKKAFKQSFQKGYFDNGERITSRQWFKLIQPLTSNVYVPPLAKQPTTKSTSVPIPYTHTKQTTLWDSILSLLKLKKVKVLFFVLSSVLIVGISGYFLLKNITGKDSTGVQIMLSNKDLIPGTYVPLINEKKDISIQVTIAESGNNRFSIEVISDYDRPQYYSLEIDDSGRLFSEELGVGTVKESKYNEVIISFTDKNNNIWEFIRNKN